LSIIGHKLGGKKSGGARPALPPPNTKKSVRNPKKRVPITDGDERSRKELPALDRAKRGGKKKLKYFKKGDAEARTRKSRVTRRLGLRGGKGGRVFGRPGMPGEGHH